MDSFGISDTIDSIEDTLNSDIETIQGEDISDNNSVQDNEEAVLEDSNAEILEEEIKEEILYENN